MEGAAIALATNRAPSRRRWTPAETYAMGGLLAIAVYFRLPSEVQRYAYLMFGASAATTMLLRARSAGPDRSGLRLFGIAFLLLVTGDTLYQIPGLYPHFPGPADAAFVGAYLVMGWAAFSIRPRAADRDRLRLIDAASVSTAVGLAIWVVWLEPHTRLTAPLIGDQLLALFYPLAGLAVVTLLASQGIRRAAPSLLFLAGGVSLFLVGDTVYAVSALDGTYGTGSWNDFLWLAAYVCWGAAALAAKPSSSPRSLRSTARWVTVPASIALLVAPAALLYQVQIGDRIDTRAIALAGVLLSILVVWRWSLLRTYLDSQEASFRLLFESNPVPMWVYDRDTLAFLAVNGPAIESYGFTEAEFLARKITDIRPSEEVPRLLEDLSEARTDLSKSGTWRHRTKDGRLLEVEIRSHLLEFEKKRACLVVTNDVTERNETERQRAELETRLHHGAKMEAVGRLAGGVAHDFNNLLSVVLNYARFIEDDMDPANPRIEDVREIRRAGERGAALVRQLLAFSREEVMTPEVMNLNDSIRDLDRLLRQTLREDVELTTKLDPELWNISADPSHLDQILMNLAVNARDAMPSDGELILETSNVAVSDDISTFLPGIRAGRYARLSVSDSGIGMSEDTRAHIFEPFFTTKSRGQGTGLGLATVYGIVKQMGGYIYAYSQTGMGSTFLIYLPSVEDDVAALDSPRREVPLAGAGQHVCVAEDENLVRELVVRILTKAGYAVSAAASGTEALEIIEADNDLQLLLTDVVMPGISGAALAQRAADRPTPPKVIFMSGYTNDIVARHGILEEGDHFIQKPFDAQDLLLKITEVLASSRRKDLHKQDSGGDNFEPSS